MPRKARLDAPGILHHVIIRGIERRNIFKDDQDRQDLLERLETLLPETNMSCYAWALMSNHAHFLFRTGDVPLSTLMRRLLTGYVVRFNRRHRRHGQLFQNRYKSIICQEDAYLRELVRYIHLNPVRAKIVSGLSTLDTFKYSGHSALMGKRARKWQDTKYVLGYFGKTVRKARKDYRAYVEKGIDQGRRPDLVGGGLVRSLGGWKVLKRTRKGKRIKGDQRILGESEFVTGVLKQADEKYERYYELRKKGYSLKTVEQRVCEICDIDRNQIYSKNRVPAIADARSLFCHWAVDELGYKLTDLAKRLGMTGPGVGYAVRRGRKIAEDKGLKLSG
ncbi:MAG: transposase [Thermodesulfobacteriota bacterium]|nr:transposase [Thermodesulfobacteriota bacterium]